MMRLRAFLSVSSVVAVWVAVTTACGDSSESKGPSEAEEDREKARQYYVDRVHNAIGSCIGCHAGASGPRFMASPPQVVVRSVDSARRGGRPLAPA